MKPDTLKIRWHGRGGQGAKTAATLLAEAAISAEKYAQGSPEYGAEREGAPMKAYTRISKEPIRIHEAIYHPDVVVVLDDSLLDSENVAENLPKDGILLVNTGRSPQEIRDQLSLEDVHIYTTDATSIALEETGRPIPNTVMMGALLKIKGIFSIEDIEKDIRKKFEDKLGKDLTEGNIRAVRRAYEEVKGKK